MSNSKSDIINVNDKDYLEVDKQIPGQNYVCVSFVSPEKTLKDKQLYFLHCFLKSMSKEYDLDEETLIEKYQSYMFDNSIKLDTQFHKDNKFKTSVRGVKIRGVYDTYREAEVRAQVLQRIDRSFHVFVGQVGYWLPWDPESNHIDNQEYLEPELNTLMKKYNENDIKRDVFYSEQVRKRKENAHRENEEKKKNYENDDNNVSLEKVNENTDNNVSLEKVNENTIEDPDIINNSSLISNTTTNDQPGNLMEQLQNMDHHTMKESFNKYNKI